MLYPVTLHISFLILKPELTMKKTTVLLLICVGIVGHVCAQIKRLPPPPPVINSKPPVQPTPSTTPPVQPTPSTKPLTLKVIIDKDEDGMEDDLEHQLLERFRPFYMFSDDGGEDNFRPVDALWYLNHSELLTSGNEDDSPLIANDQYLIGKILFKEGKFGSSDVTENPKQTGYHINPLSRLNNTEEPGRHGNTWEVVRGIKNIGLYGHVVPVKLSSPFAYNFYQTYDETAEGNTYYKIEYWQFFGYNSAKKPADIGDHEGDWASVQLIYDPEYNVIRSVFHFAHGLLFRFDITPENNVRNEFLTVAEGQIKEYRGGANYNYIFSNPELQLSNLDLAKRGITIDDKQVALAQNNRVRFFQESPTSPFEHPVVYIENGSHEFFPSEFWRYYGSPNHNGKSHHFLTATPANLGEVEHPLDEASGAAIILKFNGYWGTYSKMNTPPQGPTLHQNWLWPASSQLRKLLPQNLGF